MRNECNRYKYKMKKYKFGTILDRNVYAIFHCAVIRYPEIGFLIRLALISRTIRIIRLVKMRVDKPLIINITCLQYMYLQYVHYAGIVTSKNNRRNSTKMMN
jgi:hypothetical protein